MKKETKKVEVAGKPTVESVLATMENTVNTVQWNGVDIEVKRHLPLGDMLAFVSSIVESCFSDEFGYIPEVFDFAIQRNVVKLYSNVPLPEASDECYEMLYKTRLAGFLYEYIDIDQFSEMKDAAMKKISYRAHAMVDDAKRQITTFMEKVDSVCDELTSSLSGLNSDDVKAFMSAAINDKFDEQKIVDAYIKAKKV